MKHDVTKLAQSGTLQVYHKQRQIPVTEWDTTPATALGNGHQAYVSGRVVRVKREQGTHSYDLGTPEWAKKLALKGTIATIKPVGYQIPNAGATVLDVMNGFLAKPDVKELLRR